MRIPVAGLIGTEGAYFLGKTTVKRRPAYPRGHHDFRSLVGGGGWSLLPTAIRARFDAMSETPVQTDYIGTMKVERSRIGWLFAGVCRLFGSPLVADRGDDVPTDVCVFPVEGGGICWRRTLRFPGRDPVTVESVKVVDVKRGLLECVGGGLGMHLDVFERDGALHFTSRRYFLALGNVHIPLPLYLTPGALHVRHSDVGGTRFRFLMTFRHPWFGITFLQDGVFADTTGKEL